MGQKKCKSVAKFLIFGAAYADAGFSLVFAVNQSTIAATMAVFPIDRHVERLRYRHRSIVVRRQAIDHVADRR